MNKDQDEVIKEKVRRFLVGLTEEYPELHVQVMVTWNEAGLTKSFNLGVGNWHARQGMAHEFISLDVAQGNAIEIAEKLRESRQGGAEGADSSI